MQIFRGAALVALLLAMAGVAAPAARAQSAGVDITADVNLGDDGLLRVTETVKVPEGGEFRQIVPLRVRVGSGVQRNFEVTEVSADGDGEAKVADDRFSITARPGSATFKYTVHNTVTDATGAQVFQYTGVLNTDVASINVTVSSPSFRMGVTKCTIGPPGNPQDCTDIRVEPDGFAHLEKTDLHKGDILDVTLQLPPHTVKANADVRDDNAPGVFSLTAPVFAAFAALLAALAAAAGYVVWSRRSGPAGTEVLDPLVRTGDRVEFTSPDGMLPSTAGLLLDGHADVPDMAATVVDLAVRNYLGGSAAGESDWRFARLNPPDGQLTAYERTVYTALIPEGADSALLSERRGRIDARAVRTALIDDAVAAGVFVDRTRRGIEFWLGAGLIALGVIATVALALGPQRHALVGVAIALGGVAAVLLPRYLPARTALGRELTGQVRAMQRGLDAIAPQRVPAADQELVFSRALPFLVAARRGDQWVRTFRELDPTADGSPGLYWFGGFEDDRRLHRFGAHFPYFITAVEGLFRPADQR
ncbi:DUF2207 family protein [Nocardia seriolae]|uniref:Predicted membrane protein YciQ-like C-terminal domain-containing protein n=1 Tax=Nocardia seriolae TaxID=37332 RepID=A0A0B8NIX6_9NOCA|nr:DUF2207 domain-containing protein [Nocardia seriolae]APA94987.1 hypothetical protein NS506_00913 [Nocardia seriolae]MTJ60270.1 DUF2207 domain-containing protein [Nocardia seriolae]MTJ73112.1 DUF2207 domain-containing protein [Nocardia seriolae]MTJ85262.1 DUF2207 domain-containing protein [Nocardia seriolae]MTK29258.1 DUF2207 domain-containing protein [Nocardia seriolae]